MAWNINIHLSNKDTHSTDITHSISIDKEVSQTPQISNKHKTNFQQTQNKLPTPINSNVLSKYLFGYEHADYIIKGFREGFMLKFDGPEMAVTSQNSYSAFQNVSVVNDKIQSELSMNRLAGPFNSPPPF